MLSIKRRNLFLPLFLLLLGVPVAAQTDQAAAPAGDLTKRVDQLFAQWDKPDSPGCALAVIKDGKIVYKRGYGMADLERDVPITPKSVFDIGSTSKQFVAMSIALLARQGKLSLDDDIRKHIPEMHAYDQPVTIRHLIHHTSGIRDYLGLMALAGMRFENDYHDEEIIALIAKQKELNFKPGEEFLYSNSGYFFLAEIVKRASGKPLGEFARENIFKPLGMNNTQFYDDYTRIIKNRALGYSPRKGGGFSYETYLFDLVGDGGLLTTVEDLFLWDQNFYDNKLGGGGRELIDQVLTVGSLNNGKKLDYGFALFVGQHKGLKMISHGGAWAGYRAEMLRFPDQRFSVICLSNLGSFNPTALATKVADIYLADHMKSDPEKAMGKPAAKPAFISLPESELKSKVGSYRNLATGTLWRVYMQDGKLRARVSGLDFEAGPVSKDRFQSANAPPEVALTFEPSGDAKATAAVVEFEDRPPVRIVAYEPVTLNADQLKEYTGEFYSDELQTTYSLVIKDGKLVFKRGFDPEGIPFEPLAQDEFRGPGVTVKFTRNSQKQIAGFTVNAGRVKNIRFAKKG